MRTESVRRYTFLLACVLISGDGAHLLGANMPGLSNHFEGKTAVVYVGSVKEVRALQRTKFDIKAKAVVDIKAVMQQTAGSNPQQATIEYSSYDDKTPMMEGSTQYQLRPGVSVIAFANSFDASIPPGYLAQGSRQELLQRVEALRDALGKMSPDQLKVNEITADDRRVQMSLSESFLSTFLFTQPDHTLFKKMPKEENETSRRKNRAQRKPAESGDAVFNEINNSLRPRNRSTYNSFSNPDDRSQCVVATYRGRSRKAVRD